MTEGNFVRKPLLVVSVLGIAAALFATLSESAEAGCAQCWARVRVSAGYPTDYFYDGVFAPTYYYGGFYTPRVVFAPVRVQYGFYGPLVIYHNVRRSW